MELTKKQREILEEEFRVYEDTNIIEIEQWTDLGVDMIIELRKDRDIVEQLVDYVDNFDINEEIDLYRENKDYRERFSILESVNDFENWLNFINDIIIRLRGGKVEVIDMEKIDNIYHELSTKLTCSELKTLGEKLVK